MMPFSAFMIIGNYNEDGQLEISAQIHAVLPKIINEMELRHYINKTLGELYLQHFVKYNGTDEDQELNFLAKFVNTTYDEWPQYTINQDFLNTLRNPKSTENDHEII